MAITHTFVSAIADSTDTTIVRPSDWNANHTGTLPSSQGGTATANTSGSSITMSSFALGLVLTAATTVTLPTSGSLVTSSSTKLASLGEAGTLVVGTWNATAISAAYGGTGVANNAAATLTRSGNFDLGLTLTGVSTVTLPTSGTLLANSRTLNVSELVTGGGDLSADRTFTVTAASNTVAATGTSTITAVTPASLAYSRQVFGGMANYLFCD